MTFESALVDSRSEESHCFENMVGQHARMQELFRLIQKVAPTNSTVLIYGETGTGKELIARAIHQRSLRNTMPMQTVNCAAIPETLLESEMFGYEKGAFTGAIGQKKGMVELASHSTLFLDEIGDLGLPLQSKILRFLQEQEIHRLGANEAIKVDIRVISATHHDLHKMMEGGLFREDLYYRLNKFPIRVPPLRERKTDIPPLVHHFLSKFQSLGAGIMKELSATAMDRLISYDWPGNIRQIESALERAVIVSDGSVIEEEGFPDEILNPVNGKDFCLTIDLPDEGIILEELEKYLLHKALEKSGGVMSKAARLLGLTCRTFQYRLDKHNLPHHTKS